jgi:hypothetical protein
MHRSDLHPSGPEPDHWTVRGFSGVHAFATLHVYGDDRTARFFANGGHFRWGGDELDVGRFWRL